MIDMSYRSKTPQKILTQLDEKERKLKDRFEKALTKIKEQRREIEKNKEQYELAVMRQVYDETVAETGYAKAATMARKFCEDMAYIGGCREHFCRALRKMVERGDAAIVDTREGLRMFGPGLCGDPTKRLLKLAFRRGELE